MTTTRGSTAGAGGKPLKKLKMGMIGIGVGGAEMLPAMEAMDARSNCSASWSCSRSDCAACWYSITMRSGR